MNFELTEEDIMIRDMVRGYAKSELAPKARWRDETSTFPEMEYRKMAELGLLGMNIPESYGGSAVGVVPYSLAVTEIAKADASVAVGMSVTNMVAETIYKFARPAIGKKYVSAIASGNAIAGAFALTEPSSGSDAAAMRTTAVNDGNEWVLNGSKQYITSADHAGVFIVMAKTDKSVKASLGISAFVVEQGTPGLSFGKKENKMGLRGSSTLEVLLDDVRVPASHLMGEPGQGFSIAMTALDGGRIGVASQALGIGLAAMEVARDYSLDRRQFDKYLADFQAIKFKLADMATELEAGRQLVLKAAWLKDNNKPVTQAASMAKLFISEAANRACAEAFQIHGGYGYVKEYDVERYYRDVRITTVYEGTSEIQRMVIAKSILDS